MPQRLYVCKQQAYTLSQNQAALLIWCTFGDPRVVPSPGKKAPVLSLMEAMEGSSGGAAKAGVAAKHEKRRTLGRLMRLLFERLDMHVRSEVVAYI